MALVLCPPPPSRTHPTCPTLSSFPQRRNQPLLRSKPNGPICPWNPIPAPRHEPDPCLSLAHATQVRSFFSPPGPSHSKCARAPSPRKQFPLHSLQPCLSLPLHCQISRKHNLSILSVSIPFLPTHSPALSLLPSGLLIHPGRCAQVMMGSGYFSVFTLTDLCLCCH